MRISCIVHDIVPTFIARQRPKRQEALSDCVVIETGLDPLATIVEAVPLGFDQILFLLKVQRQVLHVTIIESAGVDVGMNDGEH